MAIVCLRHCFADVNECATSNGDCDQVCTNTIGSHACSCMAGYDFELASTGDPLTNARRQCFGIKIFNVRNIVTFLFVFNSDVDECSFANGRCQHICSNTIGSYSCSCDSGYQLANELDCEGNSVISACSKVGL